MVTDEQSDYFILQLGAGLLLGSMDGGASCEQRHGLAPLLPWLLVAVVPIAGWFFVHEAANRERTECPATSGSRTGV